MRAAQASNLQQNVTAPGTARTTIGHLVLRKHLDLAAHYIDAALIRSIELEHPVFVGIAEHFAR